MYFDLNNFDPKDKVILTDSRFFFDPEKSVFVAIKGIRHNGHDFIKELFDKGIKEFIVEKNALNPDLEQLLKQNAVRVYPVEKSVEALQWLASEKRIAYQYPVVGITGSNGKTIVKEWLNTLLQSEFDIVKSPRSYNSQIGVALSVWEMSERNTLGIFEAGISQAGEMAKLQKIISPDIGIFTNIGSAHSEGFENNRQKIREKLLLFKESKALVYCRDYSKIEDEIEGFLKPLNPEIELISWSFFDVEYIADEVRYHFKFNEIEETIYLPFKDNASIENALHCAFAGYYLLKKKGETDFHAFFSHFRFLKPVGMRLELKEGREGNYIIDDSYNNDLGGLKMALNFLSQTHTRRDKVVILSDMLQTGLSEGELCMRIEKLLKPQKIKTFIRIGKVLSKYSFNLPDTELHAYTDTKDFLESGMMDQIHKSLVLIKGAREFSFERIADRMVKKIHGTVLEINLDAITKNLNYYKSLLPEKTKVMVMVKALSYGSGEEVTSWLQYHRVDYLAVAYPDEGVSLRQNGIVLPIMVMNADPESYSTLFEHFLEPEIFSFRVLRAYLNAKSAWNPSVKSKIHIKLDTGMHRLGFVEEDLPELIQLLKSHPEVEVASIFSHLAAADEEKHDDFTRNQIELFERLSGQIMDSVDYRLLRHISNTAGISRFPEARFDMVRLGIGLYGVDPKEKNNPNLEPVAALKTTISQIKELSAGETVGYGRRGVISQNTRIATIAIGYADGYDRAFGNGNAKVMVNGLLCPTVGSICMDMCMIDVTKAECEEGDEVIIFGKDPDVQTLAEHSGTIPYEILTSISERVKRVFYYE